MSNADLITKLRAFGGAAHLAPGRDLGHQIYHALREAADALEKGVPTIGTVIDELFNQLALRQQDVGRFRFVAAIGGDGDSWWFRAEGLYVARGLQPRKIEVSNELLAAKIGASRVPQELVENFASNLVETLITKMNEAQMANV